MQTTPDRGMDHDGAASSTEQLPDDWFGIATTLFPDLTAPGVRRLRERTPDPAGTSESELEKAASLSGEEDEDTEES